MTHEDAIAIAADMKDTGATAAQSLRWWGLPVTRKNIARVMEAYRRG